MSFNPGEAAAHHNQLGSYNNPYIHLTDGKKCVARTNGIWLEHSKGLGKEHVCHRPHNDCVPTPVDLVEIIAQRDRAIQRADQNYADLITARVEKDQLLQTVKTYRETARDLLGELDQLKRVQAFTLSLVPEATRPAVDGYLAALVEGEA